VDEVVVEHAGTKDMIAQLENAGPDDDLYDAKVTPRLRTSAPLSSGQLLLYAWHIFGE
jgi:hypothetical protein